MNVESITREGHYSFPVFTRSHIRRTPLLLVAGVLSLLVIGIAFKARPKQIGPTSVSNSETTTVSTFTSVDCDAFGADAKYFQHIVNNMANHQPRRCITGTEDRRNCKCASPKIASINIWDSEWDQVFQRNLDLVNKLFDSDGKTKKHLDVIMIGDSLVEHWMGTNNTHFRSKQTGHKEWGEIHELYQQYFHSTDVRSVEDKAVNGLALGIAQDGYSNVLYRIQNGELPVNLKVPVIWINVGINDLAYYNCNADGVVAGNIAIVKAIQQIRISHDQPTRIVINSLVPSPLLSDEVRQVNKRLHCYAKQTPNVDFFDATSLFDTSGGDGLNPDLSLFADDINLNAEGYDLWGKAIVRQVLRIFEEEGI